MSDFKVVRPADITSANLITNIPDVANPYVATTIYGKGDVVTGTLADGSTRFYESLVKNNVGKPLTDAIRWLDIGATNRWRMFDSANGTQTVSDTGIDVTVAVQGRIDVLGLLNVTAEEVEVTMTVEGATVYHRIVNLVSVENINDWYAFFSEEVVYESDVVLRDLPLFHNPTIRVQVRSDSGFAGVGQMVVGHSRTIGKTVYGGASIGIQDFSKKVRDPEFGRAELQERGYAKRGDFKILLPEVTADSVSRLLAQYRARNVLWIGAESHSSTVIFGWAASWGIDFALYGQAHATLQIEGII